MTLSKNINEEEPPTQMQGLPLDVRGALAERARIVAFLRQYSNKIPQADRRASHFYIYGMADEIEAGGAAGMECEGDVSTGDPRAFSAVIVREHRFDAVKRAERNEKRLEALDAGAHEVAEALRQFVYRAAPIDKAGGEKLLMILERAINT